jgi:hypothetical protein
MKPFASWSRVSLSVDINTVSRRSRSILGLITFIMRSIGRHRETYHFSLLSLTTTTFDFNTLSCCGESYFATIVLKFPSTLFLTTILLVEETLMYFDYTYAPNLTHHGASIITGISSANGYRNPTSSNTH